MNCNRSELTLQQVIQQIPKRDINAHKGCFGRDLLLCGSIGFTGAAWFAAMGALRVGAGLVFLGVPECIYSIEAVKLNEAIVFPLAGQDGMLSDEALPNIIERLPTMNSVLLGCGMGISGGTQNIVQSVLRAAGCPVILDADAISLIKGHHSWVQNRSGVSILTPHDGEFTRLGFPLTKDRVSCAEYAARELECIILLKGHRSIITDGRTTYINTTGNPGMATGGSGDVLAGMISGLIGQGIAPLQAAACACCLHGAAGDIAARRLGEHSMLPSDLLDDLPLILKTVSTGI